MFNIRNDAKDAAAPTMPEAPAKPRRRRYSPLRILPVIVLVAALVAFFAFGLHHHLGFEALSARRGDLVAWVAAHRVLAVLVFIGGYIAIVGCSLPGATLATMLGGFLFGHWLAWIIVVFSATIGATIPFLAARTAFADILRAKAGPGLARMERGFRDNALSYLLFLRLVPLFPFVLVNLVPAFLGVPLRTFVVGTFVGIIPGTFLYAYLGGGIGALLDSGQQPDLHIVLHPKYLVPLLVLAGLALVPVLYKALKARKS